MAKTQGERIERLDEAYAGIRGDIKAIKDHLATLNGSVAENSKFRLKQQTVYGVLAFGWVSLIIPVAAIAIAVFT